MVSQINQLTTKIKRVKIRSLLKVILLRLKKKVILNIFVLKKVLKKSCSQHLKYEQRHAFKKLPKLIAIEELKPRSTVL